MTKKNRCADPCFDYCNNPCNTRCDDPCDSRCDSPCDRRYKRKDSCRRYQRCCDPCPTIYYDQWTPYKGPWCNPNPCCVPFPPCPPVLTNIVASGTGPSTTSTTFTVSFTVRNSSQLAASNVQGVVNIPVPSGISMPISTGVTQGSINQTNTAVLWTIGTLLPNQSTNIVLTFNRPTVAHMGLFTFTVSTTTPESNYNDNSTSLNITMTPASS